MKNAGFTIEESEDPSNNHCSFMKKIPNSSLAVTVELHWNLDKEYHSELDVECFWDNSISYSDYQICEKLYLYRIPFTTLVFMRLDIKWIH